MDKNKYEKIINDGMVIPVFKPLNWTSFDVVKYIRRVFQRKTNLKKIKVGHAGTLDPLATGMLIVCVGKKTKEIYKYQNQKKTYYATFKLGATTPSYDRETEINEIFSTSHININRLKICIKNFIGELDQIPPRIFIINDFIIILICSYKISKYQIFFIKIWKVCKL